MTDMHMNNSVHTIPTQFLSESALVNAVKQKLVAEKGFATPRDIKMVITQQLESETNEILADIYRQTLAFLFSGNKAQSWTGVTQR
ncbi:biofilm development regulator YmgB/AriR family protein [Dryocola clanedunensis]